MSGFLSRILGGRPSQLVDAENIYRSLMTQARRPQFFGTDRVPDTYDGRIDLLTLHIAPVLLALRPYDKRGALLSQAIYDVMRDDFDVALREEGLSDTGVSKRIKPMMAVFYGRIKDYDAALQSSAPQTALKQTLNEGLLVHADEGFTDSVAAYVAEFSDTLKEMNLGDIAKLKFKFPNL